MFFKFPKEYIVNEGFKANGTLFMVDSLDKNQVHLSYHSDIELDEEVYEGEIQNEGKVIIDRKKGYIKELISISNEEITRDNKRQEPYTSYSIERGINITSTQTPFTCQYLEDGKKSEITFDSTNVCIRGHINHPDQRREVHLQWYKREPSAFKRMGVIVPLQEDNTFEIRVHIDKLQHVFLAHNEKAEFYIMPGDDLFINLDMHAFDESIRASGVGADHVNLCFDKFLFEEKNQCSSRELGQKLYNTNEYTNPEPVLANSLATLKLKQDFLLSGSKRVSPEVLLALFWDNQLQMLQSINSYYSAISHDRRKKELQPYKRDRFSFVHYDSLIHPDNDLMAFSQEYDSFIRAFGLFTLKNKLSNESGKGHIVLVNNFYDHININNYNFAHMFFTGKTQESLKYSSINDCMKQGSWKVYEELFLKYKEEYPDSKRLAMLEETYNKSKKISPGAPAYNFKLDDLAGNSHQLSDYKGKAVYLHFWSLGCGTYGGTQRNLNKLHEAYQDSNLVIIHILTDGSNEQARAYIEKHKQRGVFLIAEGLTEILLRREYFFDAVPHFCLIDINGNFVSSKEVDVYQLLQDPKPLSDALHPMSLLVNFQQRAKQMTIISLALLILLVVAFIIFWWSRQRQARLVNIAELNQKLRESELNAIRAQMNPHFMHNCLNSIQNLVQKKENEKAHLYISKFATLIRDTMAYSNKHEISLSQEIEMVSNYITLEKLRFDIDFKLNIAPEVDLYSIFIPPMLLQPIIENAILHGLAPTKGEKTLSLRIYQDKKLVCIEIKDNGIGRVASLEKQTKGTGKGTTFTNDRLQLMSQKNNTFCDMTTSDLQDANRKACGTIVEIKIEEED